MDVKELINLGGELRGIGHRRHQLAERVSRGANEGDSSESRELYEELESVTSQAISLMEKQRDILRQEMNRLGNQPR